MTGFELDRRIREILLNARPETVLSSTAALCELGFGAWQAFTIVEKIISTPQEKRRAYTEAHHAAAHPELPRQEPLPDRLADQPCNREIRRPGQQRPGERRTIEEGTRLADEGSSRRPIVRRVQGVRQYLLAHSFDYKVDVTAHSDVVPKLLIVGKKFWIVPERVSYDEVKEHVFQGLNIYRGLAAELVRGL